MTSLSVGQNCPNDALFRGWQGLFLCMVVPHVLKSAKQMTLSMFSFLFNQKNGVHSMIGINQRQACISKIHATTYGSLHVLRRTQLGFNY